MLERQAAAILHAVAVGMMMMVMMVMMVVVEIVMMMMMTEDVVDDLRLVATVQSMLDVVLQQLNSIVVEVVEVLAMRMLIVAVLMLQ